MPDLPDLAYPAGEEVEGSRQGYEKGELGVRGGARIAEGSMCFSLPLFW